MKNGLCWEGSGFANALTPVKHVCTGTRLSAPWLQNSIRNYLKLVLSRVVINSIHSHSDQLRLSRLPAMPPDTNVERAASHMLLEEFHISKCQASCTANIPQIINTPLWRVGKTQRQPWYSSTLPFHVQIWATFFPTRRLTGEVSVPH